jgi:CheY-like chemotaxis protein
LKLKGLHSTLEGGEGRSHRIGACWSLLGREVKAVSSFRLRRDERLGPEGYEGNKADVSGDRLLRIVVAADHPLIRVGVATALKADVGLDVVGEASAGTDVLSITRSAGPDVVLLATNRREQDGLGCLSLLRERYPEVKVIVCSGSADLDHVEAVFRLGASGCILSTIAPADLAGAVRRVVEAAEYHVLGSLTATP